MLAPARDGIEDAMTALNGPRRVVRPLLHRAEHDQGAVADEFVHGTAEFEHDRRHHLPELRQQLGERIRWQRAAKQAETAHIDKQDGEGPSIARRSGWELCREPPSECRGAKTSKGCR